MTQTHLETAATDIVGNAIVAVPTAGIVVVVGVLGLLFTVNVLAKASL